MHKGALQDGQDSVFSMARVGVTVSLSTVLIFAAIGCGRSGDQVAREMVKAGGLLREGKLDEAERAYEGIVERWPRTARAHANLAYLRYEAEDYKAAVCRAQRALEIEPGLVEALTTLGNACLKMGPEHEDRGVEALEQAAAKSPSASKARTTLAAVYYRRGNLAAATANARAALTGDPSSAEARYNLAVALEAQAERSAAAGSDGEATRLRSEALDHFRRFAKGGGSAEAKEARRAIERLEPLVGGSGEGKGTGDEPEP